MARDQFAVLRSNVFASIERHDRLSYLGERGSELAEIRALGPEFTMEDRGAIFLSAMLVEFFTMVPSKGDFFVVLKRVNRNVDEDRRTGGRAWTLVRERLLDIGRQRGWSTADTVWNDWTPDQRQDFSNMVEKDLPKKSGCFVATAVYGTYDCPELWILRRFRDQTLVKTAPGRMLTRGYYQLSPIALKYGGRTLTSIAAPPLAGLVTILRRQGVSDAPYEDVLANPES